MLLFLAIFGGTLVAALLLGAFGLTVGRAGEACCARCRYPVKGLQDHTCPECGASLAEDGTLSPKARIIAQPSRSTMLMCRTMIVVIPTLILLLRSAAVAPWRWSSASASVACTDDPPFTARVSGYGWVNVTLAVRTLGSMRRSHTTLLVEGPAGRATLQTHDSLLRATLRSAAGPRRTEDGMTEAEIAECMAAAGVPASTIEDYRHEIHRLVLNTAVGGHPLPRDLRGLRKESESESQIDTPSPTMLAVVLTFAITGWIAMCLPLLRKQREPRPGAQPGQWAASATITP